MANVEFEKSSIPSELSINLRDNFSMTWVDSRSADLYRVLFASIADTLKINQKKEYSRIGMSMKDDKGNFKLGAILNFRKPEEGAEEDTGNWYLEMTFYPEDMTNLDYEVDNHSDIFVRCASIEANTITYGRFRSVDIMYNMFNCVIDTLTTFLDTNAREGEEYSVQLQGIFTASVVIEDGKKIMSIVPGEYIKQLIKNDAVL